MTQSQEEQCDVIIARACAASAVAGGLSIVPAGDIIPITAAQLAMVVAIGNVFKRSLSESQAEAMIGSAIAGQVGKVATKFLTSLIPVAGRIINASTAFALTEKMGWLIAERFDRGDF